MYPSLPFRSGSLALLAAVILGAPALAQQADGPPPDVSQILQTLKTLKEQHDKQEKAAKQQAISTVQAAASNPARAAELWEQAERVSKDADQFRAWKDGEGSALDTKEVHNALRLHFNWLLLTLQRANGVEIRELLPAVVAHTKEVTADQAAMEAFDEQLKRAKELADKSGRQGPREREKRSDEAVKALRNKIANAGVGGSPVAQMLRLGQYVADAGTTRKQAQAQGQGQGQAQEIPPGTGWEVVATNVEGIFQNIILPELRKNKDIRVMEYWDMRLRRESDQASKSKSPLEIDKFNNVRRPEILWQRAREFETIGFRNKAIGEMFSVVKANPAHPNVESWIAELTATIQPPAPVPAPTGAAAPAGVPASTP